MKEGEEVIIPSDDKGGGTAKSSRCGRECLVGEERRREGGRALFFCTRALLLVVVTLFIWKLAACRLVGCRLALFGREGNSLGGGEKAFGCELCLLVSPFSTFLCPSCVLWSFIIFWIALSNLSMDLVTRGERGGGDVLSGRGEVLADREEVLGGRGGDLGGWGGIFFGGDSLLSSGVRLSSSFNILLHDLSKPSRPPEGAGSGDGSLFSVCLSPFSIFLQDLSKLFAVFVLVLSSSEKASLASNADLRRCSASTQVK